MFGKIIGTGAYLPPYIRTNKELESMVETEDAWIVERTGIRERRIAMEESTSQMAVKAAKKALENAKMSGTDIDMIIVSSVTLETLLPCGACVVQEAIGADGAACMDINSACTGFMTAYNTAQAYINAGVIRTALVVGAESLSTIIDWTDRGSCILFGDGAGAVVLQADPAARFATVMHGDGGRGPALTCSTARPVRDYVKMDGKAVFSFAIREVPAAIADLLEQLEMDAEDVDLYLLHQANSRIISSITKRLGVSEEKVPMNLDRYGNTSSASIPILLDEIYHQGRIQPGDQIIMSGFGAGLTWAATYLEF